MGAVSRRAVLGAGFTTVGAAVTAATWGAGAPEALAAAPAAPAVLGRSRYATSVGHAFTATQGDRDVEVVLARIDDLNATSPHRSESCFNLIFTATRPLRDGIYLLSRPGLPSHELLLSGTGNRYVAQAVVNRSR